MKRPLLILFVSLGLTLVVNTAVAQIKISYIDLKALVAQMPEAKDVKAQVDAYEKQFIDQLTVMNNEFITKEHGSAGNAKMTDSARIIMGIKLQNVQKQMEDFQLKAIKMVEAKSNELLKPLSDKAIAILNAIAKENRISYIIDSSKGTKIIVSSDGTDLMAAVKAKLGIK
jgi:outer membrane protein